MSIFRQKEIEQIKEVSKIVGLPSYNFEKMSDRDVAQAWMSIYESYPFYFDEL